MGSLVRPVVAGMLPRSWVISTGLERPVEAIKLALVLASGGPGLLISCLEGWCQVRGANPHAILGNGFYVLRVVAWSGLEGTCLRVKLAGRGL